MTWLSSRVPEALKSHLISVNPFSSQGKGETYDEILRCYFSLVADSGLSNCRMKEGELYLHLQKKKRKERILLSCHVDSQAYSVICV